MNKSAVRIVGGVLLIAVGILALLQSLGVLVDITPLLWALIFGIGGALFLYVFLTSRANWWAVIPGFVLLSIGVLIALERLFPAMRGDWGGALVMGGIGLAFWVVYFLKREHWWAIIPGGVMLTIALVTGVASTLEGVETGGIFFLGLGLTFGLLAFLPSPEGRMRWAIIPAAVLLIMGLVIMAAAVEILNYLWPAALILVGVYLIFRVARSGSSD
jgi:hypothetical protein